MAQKFKCTTVIKSVTPSAFTEAENYHQKYYLQQNVEIMESLKTYFGLEPDNAEFVSCPLATKLNAFFSSSEITIPELSEFILRETTIDLKKLNSFYESVGLRTF